MFIVRLLRLCALALLIFGFIRVVLAKENYTERRKFGGHEYDIATELLYMGARYYNPLLGRFLSQDPLFYLGEFDLTDPQSFSAYSYVGNNPLRFRDPDGRKKSDYVAAPITPSRVGQLSGYYKGVAIYAGNGTYRANSSASQASQCVTGVQNLYQNLFGINIRYGLGAAKNYADLRKASNGTIDYFPQGSTMMPQENDIITWSGGAFGHIGMIVETSFDTKSGTGIVSTIEQNRGLGQTVFDYKLIGNKGADGQIHYSIEGFGSYQVMSWQRPANGAIKQNNQTANNPVTISNSQNKTGIFGKLWNSIKRFASRFN